MYTNILVPLDGTPVSEAALRYAEALAGKAGAGLTLVRSVHAGLLRDSGAGQVRAIAEAEDYLAEYAADLTTRGFTVQTGMPYGLSPAEWIVEEVDLRCADLVVMATHDRVGTDRVLHGSVAEDVVHRSPVPVVLVRAAEGLRPVEAFQRAQPSIVVPLDGSTLAESALAPAIELAKAIGGRMVLMGVVPAPGELVAGEGGAVITYVGDEFARLEDDARTYLQSLGSRVAAGGMSVTSVVRNGKPAVEIADVAHAQSAAAIVMATHARTGLARSLLGSVAGEVLHQSPSPVMLVHPPRPPATRRSSSRESIGKLIGV
jgi:nucleotide-binding universal stress UspA family protein